MWKKNVNSSFFSTWTCPWMVHHPTPKAGTNPLCWPVGSGNHLRLAFTQQEGTTLLSSRWSRPWTHRMCFLLQTHLPGTSLSGEGCGGGPISWFLLLVSISLTSRTTDGMMELISFNSSFASSPESWSISSYKREIITDKFQIRTNIEEFKNDNREKHILLM